MMTPRKNRSARTPRVYLDAAIPTGQTLSLTKQASHHLVTVLRMRTDTAIELFNGDGYNYRATLIDTGQRTPGKCAVLDVQGRYPANSESTLKIQLVQAISRGDKMDSTIRQCVELGIDSLQPLYTRHSAKVLDEKRQTKKWEHWRNIIISACEQSGRARLPTLAAPIALEQWLNNTSEQSQQIAKLSRYLLSPDAEQAFHEHVLSQLQAPVTISVLIGPESGFDTDEVALALQHGIQAVRFGPRILRTETAGPACIASIQSLLGDLR